MVVGAQSAGKSSVLRRISGIRLPEGKTLCTRVPAVMRMRRDKAPDVKVALIDSEVRRVSVPRVYR